ncbi:MAG: nitrile hydratase subunit alpha [Alphaproteobacteria bacterium]|nr:nitrile hydratase subunit alpha [Alphaproteobacteria bacterium]
MTDPLSAAHAHPHRHPPRPDTDDTLGHYQIMEIAIRELLIEKGIVTPAEIQRAIEAMDARGEALGARIVARAWTDPVFKARLMADGTEAVRDFGVDMGTTRLFVVENTPAVHNMIVCTLCSCYPRMVLGLPPDWYKSRNYRSRAVREPRGVLREFGLSVPDDVEVRVHDSTADMRYLVLPLRPGGTESLSAERLAALVSRDAMIGIAFARNP